MEINAVSAAIGTMNTDAAIVPVNASDQGGLLLASKARCTPLADHVLSASSGRPAISQASSLAIKADEGPTDPYISPINRPPPTTTR